MTGHFEQIRPAAPADLDELAALEEACFTIPWQRESIADDLTNNPRARILVAMLPSGALAGYISGWVILDEMQINNIAIRPDCRRQGYGRMLLETLIALARAEQLASMILEVRAGNAAARSLYQFCGFEAVGNRKGYYADNGEDAIIMLKNIGHNK